jgi:hypothetical protein
MNFSKYNFFYVNGCSHTEGGGLEESKIKIDSVIPLYEKEYGITWNNRQDVNFGKRLEEIIGVKCINDAKSGGGVDRVVRTTYDFIFENWNDKNKFFIILEKPDSSRSDVYYTKNKKYFIVNSNMQKNKKLKFAYATQEYYNKKHTENIEDLQIFENWFMNHYDFEEKSLQDEKAFLGLYSFCKLNSIKIFIMQPNSIIFNDCFDVDDIINFSNAKNCGIDNWCLKNKMTITDELKGMVTDYHPGYFGHIEYAKNLAEFLGWNGSYPEYPRYKKNLL